MDAVLVVLEAGVAMLLEYLSLHVLTCLVPAFFIAGAIAALLSKEAVLKYFGASARKWLSYSVASCSGTILAVCSCTILPMFAGIYKRGAGIGPACAFLFSGPAINLLAIVFTARVLGLSIGVARAVSAVAMAVVIGLIMAALFERGIKDDNAKREIARTPALDTDAPVAGRPWYISALFFTLLVAILLVAASGLISWLLKVIVLMPIVIVLVVLLRSYYSREELQAWGQETWWLTKRIFPVLLIGVFAIGLIGGVAAIYAPSHDPQLAVGELTRPYFGTNSFFACLLSSIIGAILYMPTLLEVPIVGNLFGFSTGQMAAGPALALLLAGPSLSLPSMVVIWRTIGGQKASVYIVLVVLVSTIISMIYGGLAG